MNIWEAVVLGVVEGLTEFLPVSSTGHLTIASKLLGQSIDDPSITGFTAVIQAGAIAAVIVYFRQDLARFFLAWVRGLVKAEHRGEFDHRMGWYLIVGSLPICIVGYLARDVISGPLRSLWWVAGSLIAWSFVMIAAERFSTRSRGLERITLFDSLVMGLTQCLALIPGVSRSGATISAGLFRGLDRVASTRMAFLMGIPALVGAAVFELKHAVEGDAGVVATIVGTVVSFVVAYASVAWLLKFVQKHSIEVFAIYRVALGVLLLALLSAGALSAT